MAEEEVAIFLKKIAHFLKAEAAEIAEVAEMAALANVVVGILARSLDGYEHLARLGQLNALCLSLYFISELYSLTHN